MKTIFCLLCCCIHWTNFTCKPMRCKLHWSIQRRCNIWGPTGGTIVDTTISNILLLLLLQNIFLDSPLVRRRWSIQTTSSSQFDLGWPLQTAWRGGAGKGLCKKLYVSMRSRPQVLKYKPRVLDVLATKNCNKVWKAIQTWYWFECFMEPHFSKQNVELWSSWQAIHTTQPRILKSNS